MKLAAAFLLVCSVTHASVIPSDAKCGVEAAKAALGAHVSSLIFKAKEESFENRKVRGFAVPSLSKFVLSNTYSNPKSGQNFDYLIGFCAYSEPDITYFVVALQKEGTCKIISTDVFQKKGGPPMRKPRSN